MPTVLLVCTGNICRSPMAEYLARNRTDGDAFEFLSAGTHAYPGVEASDGTRAAMAEIGIDLSDHRSMPVRDIVPTADVIYALSAEHRDALVRLWPDREPDIYLLVAAGSSIADPYGLDLDAYRRTRDEIEAAVRERAMGGWLG